MKNTDPHPAIAILILIFICKISLFSQFYDDFKDGDLSINPLWQGNTEHFVTNNLHQLQLDAPEGGSSLLFTEYNLPDSVEWGIYFKMDFSPSASNKLRIFLMADKTDLTKANGYFIEIGENGSLDNLKFYRSLNGVSNLLGSGTTGIFSAEPSYALLRITRNKDGNWDFFIKTDKDYYTLDLNVKNNDLSFTSSFFIIQCIYTSTRKDKFFFDDIYAKVFEPDNKAPGITEIMMQNKNTLKISFDESIEEMSSYNKGNYRISGRSDVPKQIVYDTLFPNHVTLNYENEFSGGILYEMTVSGIEDLSGNACNNEKKKFFLIENPQKGDLIINEVLFNPFSGGSDFVEVYNKSKKFLNLKGLLISNSSLEKSIVISDDIIMINGDYVCITEDPSDIVVNYYVPDSIYFVETKLPSFNDEEGNVSIILPGSENVIIDSFDYNTGMHSGFIDNVEGISLERKSPFGKTNERYNWTSCSTLAGGATPGFVNSVYYESTIDDEGLFLTKKVFSPDNDGYDDELKIEYKMTAEGYLLNAAIYDSKGRFIHKLINNETLGLYGEISWDGYINDKVIPLGIFILHYKMIGENGASKTGKLPFVAAMKLK